MFDVLIIQPIFNLLVLIYALLPGHNFGLAIIVFTLVVRWLMWPLVKKQMRQTKVMREMQPELKRIKKATKGNRQQEQVMMMELYKERGISPFSPILTLVIQLVILIGLYSGLSRVVRDPSVIVNNSYGFIQDLSWMQALTENINKFDNTLFGLVDLSRPALKEGVIYFPALLLVLGSAVAQYFQSKQLMPNDKDARGLKQILKDAGEGKQADSSETSAAVNRSMRYLIPVMILVFTIGLASALSLYWFFSGLVAYFQQAHALKQDQADLSTVANAPTEGKSKITIIEGEVIEKPKTKKKSANKRKRRK